MARSEPNAYREEQIEMAILGLIAFCGLIFAIYWFYIDAWYYSQLGIFTALALIPQQVSSVVFFWVDDTYINAIKPMLADLQFHKDSYAQYYITDANGASKLVQINAVSSKILMPLFIVPIIILIYKESRKGKSSIKKPGSSHAMYAYARSQQEIWPYLKPIINIMEKMSKEADLDSGWYAMAKMPIMWVKERDLLNIVKSKKTRTLFTQRERHEFTLDKPKAYMALKENLGEVWTGLDNLTFEQKCVLAVIVPHIYGKVKVSRLLNRKLCCFHETNSSLSKRELSVLRASIEKEVEEILCEHRECFETPYFEQTEFDEPYDPLISSFEELDSEADMFKKGAALVKDVLLTHAYVKTIMFGLIERSWTYGVLSSSELLWVKKVDRELFYVLSQQGRTSAFVEVCGAWAHYLSESAYGFKVLSPQLHEGLRGIDHDLFKTHDNYIAHEQWVDNSKWDKLVPDFKGKGGLPKPGKLGSSARV